MLLNDGSVYTRLNNLNMIRLIAAISVTFGHSFAMINGPHVELFGFLTSGAFGFYAVAVFFGLSGFLITQSYFRNPNWKVFLRARILRLAPGFFFANLITALLIIYVVKHDSIFNYLKEFIIYTIGGVIFMLSHSFPDVFKHLHHNSANGSMWTLTYEFRMYVVVLILGMIGLLKNRRAFAAFAAFLFILSIIQLDVLYVPLFKLLFKIGGHENTYTSLPLCFGLGMLAYLFTDKLKISVPIATAVLIATFFTENWFLKAVAWVYFSLSFGYDPKYYLSKLNFKNDISYGIYILSWPIQQCVIHLKWATSPLEVFFISMAFIIPLSIISWKFVEEPCLKWKKAAAR